MDLNYPIVCQELPTDNKHKSKTTLKTSAGPHKRNWDFYNLVVNDCE